MSEEVVDEVDLEEQDGPNPPTPPLPPEPEPDPDPEPEPLPDPVISWPPFGENVTDADNHPLYVWDFVNRLLVHTLEDGTLETRPFTEAELALIPAMEEQNSVEQGREIARTAVKAIVDDLQAEKVRVQAVIDKTNSTVTWGDVRDVARASKRIADAAIELAKFVQNI